MLDLLAWGSNKMHIVIDIEESVAILQCYVAYIYSASGPNQFRSHAVAEPTALQPSYSWDQLSIPDTTYLEP